MGIVRMTRFVEGTVGNLYEASGTRRSRRAFMGQAERLPQFCLSCPSAVEPIPEVA